ncbi:baseplate wedge subunit [Vibrio phage vB_VmeM-32]|nr:baseplate wedge subunit [Vibrio phage vB_VmeM-32]
MTIIYRSRITSSFRTENMLNFYSMVGDDSDLNSYYVTFGRDESWSDNEFDPNFAPPYPDDNVAGQADMWTRMLGAVKVPKEMLKPVFSRRDWGNASQPNPFTFKIGDIVVVNSAPYNRTSLGDGWLIYKCVDVPNDGLCSITSLINKKDCMEQGGVWTPSILSILPRGKSDAVDMEDGYLWEYLYTIPTDVAINECTKDYIIVPTPDELLNDKKKWGYDNVLEWYPNRYDLPHRMNCNTLRFRAFMDSIYFPSASKIGNNGFRQISVLKNPLERKNHPSDDDVKLTKGNVLPSEIETHSGEMIYMENRQPIIRALDQTEEINIVFQF